MTNKLQLFALGIILLLSTHLTLQFYFWHDDFSTFYSPRTNQCIHTWPYSNLCPAFNFLVSTFGYTPFPYFFIGIIFATLSLIAFYSFAKRILNQTSSFFISLLFATSYIASGVFLEAWDPIVSFSTLGLLLLSLVIFLKSTEGKINQKLFALGLFIFIVSLTFQFRSPTNFVPVITLLLIFPQKISLSKKILLATIVLLTFYLFFFLVPVKILNSGSDTPQLGINLDPSEILYLSNRFLQTLSSFLFTDFIQSKIHLALSPTQSEFFRTSIGLLMLLFLVSAIFFGRKNSQLSKVRIFGLIWIVSMYLPYGMRTDTRLESTHRYLLWAYPGVLLAWATFSKHKLWLPVTFLLIIISFISTTSFFREHLIESLSRQSFYSQLHKLLVTIPENSTLFFDFSPKIRLLAEDFFRVGLTPPESALATEYGMDYKKIRLITDNNQFSYSYKDGNIQTDKLFTFYYDGQTLINTTQNSKQLSGSTTSAKLDQKSTTSFIFDETANTWTGENGDINFTLPSLQLLIPSTISLDITASSLSIPLPYTQNCLNCLKDPKKLVTNLKYLTQSKQIKSRALVQVSNSWEDTSAQSLLDDKPDTFWIANRQLWYHFDKPALEFNLPPNIYLSGLIFYSNSHDRIPIAYKVWLNYQLTENSTQPFSGGTKLLFNSNQVIKKLKVEIIQTSGGDTPTISEINFIPSGFADIDPLESSMVETMPAGYIQDTSEATVLQQYLSEGTVTCLKWKAKNYGEGIINFPLYIDGRNHEYNIELPVTGLEEPLFTISCLNYPLSLNLHQAKITF